MALSDLTFKFYTDSGLTTAFSGLYQLTNETDLSDNPQDKLLYFGSAQADSARTLQATSNPGVDQITLTPTFILGEWVASTAYSLGDLLEPTTPNTYKYKATSVSSDQKSNSVEPTWPTTIGSTVVDNNVVWTCYAHVHPITEIKLATSSGGLSSATGGAALNIGTTLTSGTANKVAVYIRFTNSLTSINTNTGFPELALYINEVEEVGA